MTRKLLLTISLSSLVVGCAGEQGAGAGPVAAAADAPVVAPTQRYVAAVEKRVTGDSRGYFDEMLALAHEEPDSRAGRRARATLEGPDLAALAAGIGVLAAIAVPNFQRYQARAKQSEPKATLKGLFVAEKAYFAEYDRYCRTFKDCGYEVEPATQYLYFLGGKEVRGAELLPGRDVLVKQARAAMNAAGVTPKVDKRRFVLVAVGNLDDDADLDIWTIDQDNNLMNVADDTK